MDDLITTHSSELEQLIAQIDKSTGSVTTVRMCQRPTLADERYLSGEEIMTYLHISPRTLQTLRDNRVIAFTTIGGKILYPEQQLQKVLLDNLHPPEEPF